jgi:hypothetical protein
MIIPVKNKCERVGLWKDCVRGLVPLLAVPQSLMLVVYAPNWLVVLAAALYCTARRVRAFVAVVAQSSTTAHLVVLFFILIANTTIDNFALRVSGATRATG